MQKAGMLYIAKTFYSIVWFNIRRTFDSTNLGANTFLLRFPTGLLYLLFYNAPRLPNKFPPERAVFCGYAGRRPLLQRIMFRRLFPLSGRDKRGSSRYKNRLNQPKCPRRGKCPWGTLEPFGFRTEAFAPSIILVNLLIFLAQSKRGPHGHFPLLGQHWIRSTSLYTKQTLLPRGSPLVPFFPPY
jgi:hypothetical protein